MTQRIGLEKAAAFHGHLGPYLVLGLKAGEFAIKKLGCTKYFGLEVKVFGAQEKPKSCLIDGLQLSTGATFGKGNIFKFPGKQIRIEIAHLKKKAKIVLFLLRPVEDLLSLNKSYRDCELLAKKFYKMAPARIFALKIPRSI